MAKVVQTTLQISESNVEQYCIADGLSLNTGGYAIRLYLNGHTQGSAILNDAAKEVLYPSATAHPFKIDSFIRANKSGGSMTISLRFNGTSVQSESGDWGSGLKNKTKNGISDPVVINSNRSTEIKWHIKGSSAVSRFSIASTRLTFYFNQYEMRPLVGNNANGIQKVTVSNASPYQGDTVTFTPKLVNGATWDGWYSDAACTQLVSTEQNYSVSPSSDITLYAKATIDATLYNVSAVAGSEVTSVSVSDSIVPEGGTATFTAQVNTGCSFEAWYSDDTYTTVVSTENPYTATITTDTTLYAKARRNELHMSVGTAEHGTASVSATTVPYGNDVTFTFAPEDETWELYGWYSDSALTQLVSEANPYTFTPTEDMALYPMVGKKRFTITVGQYKSLWSGDLLDFDVISFYYDRLTKEEVRLLRTGEFDSIDQSKVIEKKSASGNAVQSDVIATILCPCDAYIAIYAKPATPLSTTSFGQIKDSDGNYLTYWPYYWYQPSEDAFFEIDYLSENYSCNCSAIAKDGIDYAYATTPTRQEREAIFEAEVSPGYTFSGWYTDEACTRLTSADNPAYIKTPKYIGDTSAPTSVTLYAKGTKVTYTISVGTAEHGSASASATTAYYGDTVTFNCTVDEGYQFKGWYSDVGLSQLVSEDNPYTFTVTEDVMLYPKVGIKRYTITVGQYKDLLRGDNLDFDVISFYYDRLTKEEVRLLRTGEFDNIDQSKVIEKKSASGSSLSSDVIATILCPFNAYIAIYAKPTKLLGDPCFGWIRDGDDNVLANWPYYWCQPSKDTFFRISYDNEIYSCNCSAIAKDGIDYAYATTPTRQGYNAIFEAETSPGYAFSGWYSDELCTQLVSSDNPVYVTTPKHDLGTADITSLTLYAKATKKASGTGIYIKQNGAFVEVNAVYKKVNGAWVQQNNPASLFNGSPSGTESNYLYLGE